MVTYHNISYTKVINAVKSKDPKTLVIKIGTSSICDEKTHYPLLSNLSRIVETILHLKTLGHRVVLVTSGAVGVGLLNLGLVEKPKSRAAIQAIAAVGQGRLMSMYDDLFGRFNQPIAQILLTRNDLADRSQYLNAVNCLTELLDMDIVPIVNENDTISDGAVRFGDNDTLSAITAGMVRADYLFLMTDVDCLYTDNPRTKPDARAVLVCDNIEKLRKEVCVTSMGSSLGTGGMMTKLVAAELATAAGVTTIIARGSTPENIIPIITQDMASTTTTPLHTRFLPNAEPLVDRKWWILHGLHTAGTIEIEDEQVLLPSSNASSDSDSEDGIRTPSNESTDSLFEVSSFPAMAVKSIKGSFIEHQAVNIVVRRRCSQKNERGETTTGDDAVTIAKGIVNFSSAEIIRILEANKNNKMDTFGYDINNTYLMNPDNIAVYA
ncbi:glutamate 5-kinase [Mucor ambiguus]|uniref:Glutamate 5-kinase n=1 Tax=Mucor ambiguus TaxID=91626 RepID=A0A0C9MT15_9FUNG|nr:glutamate 5-kinase [Mucor ambiguus]